MIDEATVSMAVNIANVIMGNVVSVLWLLHSLREIARLREINEELNQKLRRD